MIGGEFKRVGPEFAGHPFPPDMNMWRLVSIETVRYMDAFAPLRRIWFASDRARLPENPHRLLLAGE